MVGAPSLYHMRVMTWQVELLVYEDLHGQNALMLPCAKRNRASGSSAWWFDNTFTVMSCPWDVVRCHLQPCQLAPARPPQTLHHSFDGRPTYQRTALTCQQAPIELLSNCTVTLTRCCLPGRRTLFLCR